MFRFNTTLLAVAILCLGTTSAHANTGLESLPIGSVVKGTAQLEKKQFPLPPGDWQLVSRERRVWSGGAGGGGPFVFIYLAQFENGVLAKAISAQTNLEPTGGGWVRDRTICDRADVHHAVFDRNYNVRDAECWTVNHLGMSLENNAWQVVKDFFRATDDKKRPKTALGISYFLVSHNDHLRLIYYTNPELAGFEPTPTAAWPGNHWHRDVMAGDAKRVAYIQQLKAEGEKLLPLVKAGLRGALPPGTIVSPGASPPPAQVSAPSSPSSGDAAERMRQLKRLFDEKLITEAEYDDRRRKVLDGM